MEKREIYDYLESLGIPFEVTEHPAVYTIEEMERISLPHMEDVCKNLFLRDARGKRHFLVVMEGSKNADLEALGALLGTKLSFASEERLDRYLGLRKGAVTPLGVLNDPEGAVTLVFDNDLKKRRRVGVHPNDNTATIWLSFTDLESIVRSNGNPIVYTDF